jgi:hypothetical protein
LRFEVGFRDGEDQVIHLRKRLMRFFEDRKAARESGSSSSWRA